MSDDDFEPFEPVAELTPEPDAPAPITRPVRQRPLPSAAPDRSPPHSAEAEEHVIATVLLDNGETLQRAIDAGLTPESFYFPANRLLYEIAQGLRAQNRPVMLETLAEELKTRRQLEAIGGFAYLMQVTGRIPTTAHAGYFIEKVREKAVLREAIKTATGIVERAYGFTGGLDEFLAESQFGISRLTPGSKSKAPARPLSSFSIPPKNDPSVLLGNRYLNRGDGLILSGPSGMGKSSISLQAAACWAIGRPFMGIPPNGCLKILIVQSEDSDGDIAEVWASIVHCLAPSAEDLILLDKNIRIVTDRVNRGTRFVSSLRAHVAEFKPDIAILNPLQAFIDGDVTESKDIGAFLREGLNGLNEPPTFGYLIVHHTTKPATGKDRSERLWHEVMYDMAGGAEIINWARGIISLRPTATEGTFRLILAKRGRRAGVVREVEQGAGTRMEPVTTIGMRHSTGKLPSGTPIIFWEPCALTDDAPKKESTGRPSKYKFSDYRNLFPPASGKGMALNELERALSPNGPISRKSLHDVVVRWMENDEPIEIIDVQGQPRRYRLTV